ARSATAPVCPLGGHAVAGPPRSHRDRASSRRAQGRRSPCPCRWPPQRRRRGPHPPRVRHPSVRASRCAPVAGCPRRSTVSHRKRTAGVCDADVSPDLKTHISLTRAPKSGAQAWRWIGKETVLSRSVAWAYSIAGLAVPLAIIVVAGSSAGLLVSAATAAP